MAFPGCCLSYMGWRQLVIGGIAMCVHIQKKVMRPDTLPYAGLHLCVVCSSELAGTWNSFRHKEEKTWHNMGPCLRICNSTSKSITLAVDIYQQVTSSDNPISKCTGLIEGNVEPVRMDWNLGWSLNTSDFRIIDFLLEKMVLFRTEINHVPGPGLGEAEGGPRARWR